ncbi:MAG TPA: hypothetical protein VE869_10590, partial [Gemmatimonas sp.]|nr:hypothetical protein [Gemmatimonas sp.]
RVRAVTADDVLRVARTHLDPERLQVIVVGDPAIEAELASLDLGPVTVHLPDIDANVDAESHAEPGA